MDNKKRYAKPLVFFGLSIVIVVGVLAMAEPLRRSFPHVIVIMGSEWPDPVIHSEEVLLLQNQIQEKSLQKETCERQTETKYMDKCYWELARQDSHSSFCDWISDAERRDTCYFYFVFREDYSVCSRLTDVYLRGACFSLKGQPWLG